MSWRKITFIVVALIVLLGGAAALSLMFVSMKPEPPRRPDADMIRYVKAEKITYSDIISPLSREGRVVSSSEVMLVSEAAGKIEKGDLPLRKGTSFRKGQLLAVIYKDEAELELKANKSNFLTTITTLLPDIKVDFPEQYSAFSLFFNTIDMEQDLPDFPEIKNEKLKIFLASRDVFSEYYRIKQDEKKLSRHSLYAPFNGTFTLVNYEVGAYVNTGGQIAQMIRTDELEVEVPVENVQSKWIKIGDKVKVYPRDKRIENTGIVVRKSDFVDPATQARSIFIKVKDVTRDKLLAGEYKLVVFPGQLISGAMEIPRNAVFNTNEVFTVVDGKLNKQIINILKWNETTLIFNGLKEGVKVVVEPLINAKENSPVGVLGEEVPVMQGKKKSKDNSHTQAEA